MKKLIRTSVLVMCAAFPAASVRSQSSMLSTDVAWLEKAATMSDTEARRITGRTGKMYRGQAYARLGEIGSRESLAAVDRIEAAARKWSPYPAPFSEGVLPHPGWHMSDSIVNTNVRASVDGVTYAVFPDYLFGGMDLLLIYTSLPANKDAWSRPYLVPLKIYRGMHDLKLAPGEKKGTLLLSYVQDPPPPRAIMEGTFDRGETAPKTGPQSAVIDIAQTLRDSDHDGVTDVEEARLGLAGDLPDSDGDGIPDGSDTAPDYAPPRMPADDELIVLQKAFFATFGISGSRYTMFVDDTRSRRIQPWGFHGQVIYRIHPKEFGAVSAGWNVKVRTSTSATVELSDGEGPLAAGGVEVRLEKKNGKWYVVAVQTTWIS